MSLLVRYSATASKQNEHGVENKVIGENFFLNQANGTPISLSPGIPDLEDQFGQMGIVDLRAHDWYGVADIDSYYDTTDNNFIDQITNNAPDDLKDKIKSFTMDFFNRRTICLNTNDYFLNDNVEPLFNWVTTDYYFKKSLSNSYYKGSQKPNILYRIGRIINGGRQKPLNVDKYCNLVEEVVKRYSLNYKSIGLPYPITEYEIWNEPDLGIFWSTPNSDNSVQEFYNFYSKE